MKYDEVRDALAGALSDDPEGLAAAEAFLSVVRHDLANLFGTVTMESHLLPQALQALGAAVDQRDDQGVRAAIAELRETSDNLALTVERAKAYLDTLREGLRGGHGDT